MTLFGSVAAATMAVGLAAPIFATIFPPAWRRASPLSCCGAGLTLF